MARAKRRCMHGKRLKRSAFRKEYDFTKKTRDYSPEGTKDTIGAKLVKAIVPKNTPAGIFGAVAGGGVLRNAPKIVKAIKTFARWN